jgi:putative membrane protein
MLVFGFYEPFMEILAHPKEGIKKHWRLIFPFTFGVVGGFWLTAVFLSKVFSVYEIEATCLFTGIVAGMFPAMFRDADKKGHERGAWAAFGISTVFMLAMLEFFQFGPGISVKPDFGWYVFCGLIWGLSMIIPGMNTTSLQLFMGLYIPMTTGLGKLDMSVVVPWLIGIALALFIFSRLVKLVFDRFYGIAMYCIIGTALASTIPTIPIKYESSGQIILCIMLAVAGAVFAVGIDKLEKISRERLFNMFNLEKMIDK